MASAPAGLNLTYRDICPETITREFSCYERDLDGWFCDQALRDHQTQTIITKCAYLPGIASPAGFYSVASVVEAVASLPGQYHNIGAHEHFPCLQLAYLAVHRRYQKRGIGSSMVGAVTSLFADLGCQLGIPHLVLVPINEKIIPFYEDKGFTCYNNENRMYLSLQSAMDAFQNPAL